MNGRATVPCQNNLNHRRTFNAIYWLIILEIIKFKHQKKFPTNLEIFENVKKTLKKLSKKNPKNPYLIEFLKRGSLPFHNPRPPEEPALELPIQDAQTVTRQ